jgi:hypothetical protein
VDRCRCIAEHRHEAGPPLTERLFAQRFVAEREQVERDDEAGISTASLLTREAAGC